MSIIGLFRRIPAIAGLAVAQLRYHRFRTLLAVVGIVLAMLTMTLLAGTGLGVLETGESQFESADRDLWVTSGPVALSAATGGFENTLYDAHVVSDEMNAIDGVRTAVPLGFQTVYISEDGEEFDTIVATGTTGTGSAVSISDGDGFSGGDTHYAGGEYDGPMSHEVLIDPQLADRYDLSVGDTVYMGGTTRSAEQNEFTVVGISGTFSQFLGTPTSTLRLSELQTITGSSGVDSATFITITLEDDADPEAVQTELQAAYPEYEVRTNAEQLNAVLQHQSLVLAGAVTLVVLAFIAGLALTANLLAMVVYQQREALAAINAIGVSRSTIVGLLAGHGLAIGILGGAIGAALTPPAARALNFVAAEITGFEGLVVVQTDVILAGVAIAIAMGTLSASVAAWRVSRLSAIESL
ncbi:MAG: ABC transporter permease [Halobacteriota archaeon]